MSPTEAQRVLKVIEELIINGEPNKAGKTLRGSLTSCRRIRTGAVRIIIYRINGTEIVPVLCTGQRRDDEVYETALGQT